MQFVGINTQDSGRGLADAEKWGIAGVWPLAKDIGGSTGSGLSTGTFGMRGSPMTAFYDAEGTVVHVQLGGLTGAQLADAIEQLFQLGHEDFDQHEIGLNDAGIISECDGGLDRVDAP